MGHQDRFPILACIGVLLLLLGAAGALIGPIEVHTFYLFSEGKSHYEGFRFGSFMFANIACQVLFYYLLAVLGLPLGYGHLRARRWARVLALVLLWDWLVVSLPVSLVLLFMLLTAKAISPLAVVLLAVAALLGCTLFPLALIRFYRGQAVRLTVEARDPGPSRIEAVPLPVLVLGSLCIAIAAALHLPMLMNGLFPFFGAFLSGANGFAALAVAIPAILVIAWGVFRRDRWAWWAALVYLAALTVSLVLTLARATWQGILALWGLPPVEVGWLQAMPIQGYHLAAILGLPLSFMLVVALVARRHVFAGAARVLDAGGIAKG